jgi:hypothetical protein
MVVAKGGILLTSPGSYKVENSTTKSHDFNLVWYLDPNIPFPFGDVYQVPYREGTIRLEIGGVLLENDISPGCV